MATGECKICAQLIIDIDFKGFKDKVFVLHVDLFKRSLTLLAVDFYPL